MDVELARPQGFGKAHLTQRLARTRPDPAQRAERRPEINAGPRLGAVVGRHVNRRQAGLQFIEIDSLAGFRQRTARRHAPFHVQRPVLVAALAEDLEITRRRPLGIVEHHLHSPPLVVRPVRGGRLGKDQGVLQLHVFHDHRAAALGKRRRGRHRAVERAWRHQPPEDSVVVQPRRIGRKHFRLERDLAASGFVPDAEQGMTGVLAPSLRRLDPVALALERISRQ